MVRYRASAGVFAGVGMQRQGLLDEYGVLLCERKLNYRSQI
jgi:hypothetical protein